MRTQISMGLRMQSFRVFHGWHPEVRERYAGLSPEFTHRISDVAFAVVSSSGVMTSFTKVGIPLNALRTKFKCLDHVGE